MLKKRENDKEFPNKRHATTRGPQRIPQGRRCIRMGDSGLAPSQGGWIKRYILRRFS